MLLAYFAAAAVAPEASPRKILFVGNSFTFGALSDVMTYRPTSVNDLNGDGIGGVPALFKRFADETGLHYEVSLETSPGKSLTWHLANKREVIDRPWDAVVLQEYSTVDPDLPGNPARTIKAARQLADMLRKRNPHADLSLIATWTRPDLTFPPGQHWSGQPVERMALDIRKADEKVHAAVPAISRIIPVGQAFTCAIARGIADGNPYDSITAGKVDLWASDHYHASGAGYYLEALTIFASVTHTDPRKLGANEAAAHDLGISPSLATKLQAVAHELATGGHCRS
jgi:hypothetical protein